MLPSRLARSFSAAVASSSKSTQVVHANSPAPSFSLGQFEHRLSSQPSPMVSLAMTVPAGTKYSIDAKDSGSVAAYYKHALLQGTKNESRIALARKADLRPSPMEITQSRDLLCFSSHFHVNYLPDLLETFAQLLPSRPELEIEEAVVQGPVREAALLDASIAREQVRVELAEAAWMTAFRTNHLYAQVDAPVTASQLASFHASVLGRGEGFSLLLGTNDASIISAEQFRNVAKASGISLGQKSSEKRTGSSWSYFGGESRIEDASRGTNSALLAFSLPSAGIAEANFPASWLMQSLLSALTGESQNVYSSTSAAASLHGVFFESTGASLKDQISALLAKLKSQQFPDLKAIKHLALHNYALSLDSRSGRLLSFASQSALRADASFLSEAEMSKALESLSADQFYELVAEAVKKPTLVSKGALKELPYLADI